MPPTAPDTGENGLRDNGVIDIDAGGVVDLRHLATGPVATSYAGRLADSDTEIAIKMFPDAFDRPTVAEMKAEWAALDTIRAERSILAIDGLVRGAGRTGVWMELCAHSLADLLGAGGVALAPRDVAGTGVVLATALAWAHEVGVVHGGVTPHNVLYRRTGEVALADFGLALRERFPRDPAHAVEYTAPETLRDDIRSAASDVYGLGAVLYTALAGVPPFPRHTGLTSSEWVLRVLGEPVPPITRPDVPDELTRLVTMLLVKDPAARPDAASVAEALADWYRALTAEPAPAPDPPAPTEPKPSEPPEPSRPAVPAPGGRTLVLTTAPVAEQAEPRTRWRPGMLTALAAVILALITVPIVLGKGERPVDGTAVAEAPAPPSVSAPPSAPAREVNLVLAPVADQGDHVELNWRADGELDFGVVVAGERLETTVLAAHRKRTLRVPVDPARAYCFQVRATDGRQIYTTEPVPIRGARCKL